MISHRHNSNLISIGRGRPKCFPLPGTVRRSLIWMWIAAFVFLVSCAPQVVRENEAGNDFFEEEAYAQAVEAYKQAQVADPDRAEPYYNAANALNRTGSLEETLAQTQQALKDADPALAGQAWYNLGNAYFDVEQWGPAVEAYKEALRILPDDGDAKHNLELALQKIKEQQEQQENPEQQEQDSEQKPQEEQTPTSQPGEQPGATPTPEAQTSEPGEDEATPQPSQTGESNKALTEEEAMQLLNALLSDQETLQEHLQHVVPSAGPTPEQDW